MKQRRRRSGQRIHTSRAKTRSRQDHTSSTPELHTTPRHTLRQWLTTQIQEPTPSEAHALSLTHYLRQTQPINLPPEERLRQLAIHLEEALSWTDDPQTADALSRVYTYAQRMAPNNTYLLHSHAVSLQAYAETSRKELLQRKLYDTAWALLQKAITMDTDPPLRAEIHYTAGLGRYMAPHGDPSEAYTLFERALDDDPSHPWALLYRAHSLHDQQRWREAVAAYEAVPQQAFDGAASWRMHTMIEQRGYCRWKAGDLQGARNDLKTIAQRYAAQPHLGHGSGLAFTYLREACKADSPLRDALHHDVSYALERCDMPPLEDG